MSSVADKKKHANCARETPNGVDKIVSTPIGDSSRLSGKKENQSISVINNFFPDYFFFLKLNGKKLDFSLLKGLDKGCLCLG